MHSFVPLSGPYSVNQERSEMKNLIRFVLISALLVGVFGCSAQSSEQVAADARVEAANARVNAADADARVKAADAHVKAADARVDAVDASVEASKADARVKTTTTPAAKAAAVKERLTIPSGTVLNVLLIDGLGTDTNSAGDHFLASLAEPVVVDGSTLLPKGTKVRGSVIAVEASGRVKGLASIRLALTDIMQGNRMVAIATDTFTATAESSTTRDGEIIAGSAGVGAVIGAIADGGKGAGIGALTGGGAGTGVVLLTKGKEIRYAPETRLSFTLANSVPM
jgi:hypothetical protein